MKKICDWCELEYEDNLTPDELDKQLQDDLESIIKLGYEPTGTSVEVCDECFNKKDTNYGINKRIKK